MNAPSPATQGSRGLVVLLGCFLMLQPLSTDMYLASLPGLVVRFSTSIASVQLTLSVFILGFGIMQLVSGPLSDRFGRRPVILAGLSLYVAATLACAAAPTIETLIVARFAQAVGGCTAVVVARAIVRDVYGPVGSARALAQALTVLALGPIFGPLLGAALEVRFGHVAIFLALAAFASVLLVLTTRRLPETNAHRDPHAAAPGRLLGNYWLVLRSHEFNAFALLGAASYGGLFAFLSSSSFVFITVLDVPTAWFGALFASVIVGYLLGTLLCQRILARRGMRAAVTLGASLAAVGGGSMALLAHAGVAHWAAVAVPQFVYMASHGINFTCATAGSVAPFPRHAGAAAGMFGFLAMAAASAVGMALGTANFDSVFPLAWAVALAGGISLATAMLAIRPLLATRTTAP